MINIFIGYDRRERAASNVLIDSLYQHSSLPLSINILKNNQLTNAGLYWRQRDPKQSTDFSFTRFLVPHLISDVFVHCSICRTYFGLLISL